MNYIEDKIQKELELLKENGGLRCLPHISHNGKFISACVEGSCLSMLNLSSNDYLGLASDRSIREDFLKDNEIYNYPPSSSSSRLLTGNFGIYTQTEKLIAGKFGREAALLFGSGYQMNTGILPAVADSSTLILADKLVHASIIDGIKLSSARCIRYRHQDYEQLEMLVKKHYNTTQAIIIVTESIFSMDGDVTDLGKLVTIKHRYPSVMLYVDEAHGIGARGTNGLGIAEEQNCINDIDFLCGTLGKALASTGAYVVCSKSIKEYLTNKMRSFIYTTALPPASVAWTEYVFNRLEEWNDRRKHLSVISGKLINKIKNMHIDCISGSHIVPLVLGSNEKAMSASAGLQKEGFYVLPIRRPTVSAGTERLRFSLTAECTDNEINKLISTIESII